MRPPEHRSRQIWARDVWPRREDHTTSIHAEEKAIRQRLGLELEEAVGDASQACRRRGVSSAQFH